MLISARNNVLGSLNVSTKCDGNPSKCCQAILLKAPCLLLIQTNIEVTNWFTEGMQQKQEEHKLQFRMRESDKCKIRRWMDGRTYK